MEPQAQTTLDNFEKLKGVAREIMSEYSREEEMLIKQVEHDKQRLNAVRSKLDRLSRAINVMDEQSGNALAANSAGPRY